MARHRFYSSPTAIDGSLVVLSASETHHLANVLRLEVGDQAFVFDGLGREYRCRVAGLRDKRATLEIVAAVTGRVESPMRLTLAQALAKAEKFDLIVQKATELGVSSIVPLVTRRSEVKLTGEAAAKRLKRWRQISLEASKQCGRRTLVEIRDPLAAKDLPSHVHKSETVFVFSERDGAPITKVLPPTPASMSVSAVIGPEGGWSDEEVELFEQAAFEIVTLGPRILRTETAAIVAIALLQHAMGDLSTRREAE